MSKYVVIKAFKDLQDKNKIYEVNDSYPTPANKKISDKRIKELTGSDNRHNEPLIREVKEEKK